MAPNPTQRALRRNNPGGGGQGVGGEENNRWPDGDFHKFPPTARPKRDKGKSFRKRGPYKGLPPFDTYPERRV